MMIEFIIRNQTITRTDCFKVVAMSRNYLHAYFDFRTDEWQGVKTAIFARNGMPSISVVLEQDNTCLVPWEWLEVKDDAVGSVSVFCGDLVTANRVAVQIYKSGYEQGQTPLPSTPDAYSWVLSELEKLRSSLGSLDLEYEDNELTLLVDKEPQASVSIEGGSGVSENKVKKLIDTAIEQSERNILQQVQGKIDELEIPNVQSGRVYLFGHYPMGLRGQIQFPKEFQEIPVVAPIYQGDGSADVLPVVQAYAVTTTGFEYLVQDLSGTNQFNAFMNWVAIGA